MRFSARVLDAGVHWISPVWVSAARREAALPLSVYGPVGLIASVTILFAAMWLSFCRRHLWTYAFRPDPELIEAGDWILQKALRRKPLLVSGGRALPAQTTVRDELDAWVNGLRDSIGQEQSNQAAEIQRDLNLAKDFQQAYLDRPYPKIPAVHVEGRLRLNFYHRYEPASALGGDFYNIISFQDSAGVFIGDVMGHGTRSALITAIIRTLIDDLSSVGRNARHFLTEMNNQFCALLQNVPHPLFASAFYFVADTTARVCTFSSAGHPAPFHVRRSVGRITRLDVPAPRGAALGLMPKETYTGGYGRLEDGDVFIFFTDGVYEVHNSAGDEFGIGRMERVIQKLMYKPVAEIVDGIIEAIVEFAGEEPVADDICMIAVEVTTRAEQE
jgi:serine phosphatase RsbU (regulator of sigma subunit)